MGGPCQGPPDSVVRRYDLGQGGISPPVLSQTSKSTSERIMKFRLSMFLTLAVLMLAVMATLKAGEPLAWPVPDWKVVTPESQGVSSAGMEKVRQWLAAHGSKTGLVVRHGYIVGEWYFDDAKP